MVGEILFFIYIFAGFISIMAIMLTSILSKYRAEVNRAANTAMRGFMVCTLAIVCLYFYIAYKRTAYGEYGANALTRMGDIFFYIGQTYFWARYIRESSNAGEEVKCRVALLDRYSVSLLTVIAVAVYGILMNGYYYVRPGACRYAALCGQFLIIALLLFMLIWNLVKTTAKKEYPRKLLLLISFMVAVNELWNSILVFDFIEGDRRMEYFFDPTPVFILIINAASVLILIKGASGTKSLNDGEALKEQNIDINVRLCRLAELNGLTEREKEVMKLAYEGMTNPQIAEELCISKYTVKRHMHNIFEKLGISTRVELIHLVNE